MIKEFFKNNENILIAHRGNSFEYPENTKIAFENATYAKFIELDILFTKNFEFVVFHDDTLNRTTNYKEVFQEIKSDYLRDYTYEELSKLDVSSWFKKDIEIQKIMKLEEVIILAKKLNIYLNIEIKEMKDIQASFVAKKLYELLKKNNFLSNCFISSFEHIYLKELKELDKTIVIAPLFYKKLPKDIEKYLETLKADFFHIDETLVNKALINSLKRKNIFTNVYTINSQSTAKKLFNMGIKGIFSDKNLI